MLDPPALILIENRGEGAVFPDLKLPSMNLINPATPQVSLRKSGGKHSHLHMPSSWQTDSQILNFQQNNLRAL